MDSSRDTFASSDHRVRVLISIALSLLFPP
ncbi:unannotated protein [freshwater metagenome]|uniref:Unannotated protein n=1 Tax=freshwater metagenome TaxID=449393 RepID=A0A6J7L2N3_9ZZZZ